MKVIDLFKKIENGENIPQKIKVNQEVFKWDILEHYYKKSNGDDLLELCTTFNTEELLSMEVELIEDEIDIDSIEELNDTCYDVNIMSDDDLEFYHNKTRTTMNKILQAVKQIDKKVKELEGK